VGIYAESGTVATSTGSVTVGDNSVAYYAAKGSFEISGTSYTENGVIHIAGTTAIGTGSTLIYAKGGNIEYTAGNIVLGDDRNLLVIEDGTSSANFHSIEVSIGARSTGIYVKEGGEIANVTGINRMTIGEGSSGVYIDGGNDWTTAMDMSITGEKGTAIQMTGTGDIAYSGTLTSSVQSARGILLMNGGSITNSGAISLTGQDTMGLYGMNTDSIENSTGGLVAITGGADKGAAVAIYGNRSKAITNRGTVSMIANAVGIYGIGAEILNDATGLIKNAGQENTGIYAKGGSVKNKGSILLGDTSNGIYAEDYALVENTGNITVGGENAAGIYATGSTEVKHLGGTVTTGQKSIGIASGKGNITVAKEAKLTAGAESTYIYTEDGTATNDSVMTLSDYSMGMYAKDGTLVNGANGRITTGTSWIGEHDKKLSFGMATGTGVLVNGKLIRIGGGTLVNNGIIDVTADESVGMAASNPGAKATNNGTINVSGTDAYGMVASEEAILHNSGTINVTGTGARGMEAYNYAGAVNDKSGKIYVSGADARGIYVASGGYARNEGEIVVDGAGRVGIFLGDSGWLENSATGKITVKNGGTDLVETSPEIGVIRIENKGPLITVGNTVYDAPTLINGGYIDFVDGVLDFGAIKIASPEGNIGTISAESFAKGEFIVLPQATQGNNDPVRIIQYLRGITNLPNDGAIKAISLSVTWVADIQADPDNVGAYRIILIKVPYAELTKNTKAYEFGLGLDELYARAAGPELDMFDKIDLIADKDELASTFDMQLRGNLYANIQQRMADVKDSFDETRENLRTSGLYTKENLKIGAIAAGGNTKDKNPGVEDYDYKSAGFMVMKDYALRQFGQKFFWDAGFAGTTVDFDFGSEEKIMSLEGGAGYEQILDKNGKITWTFRGSAAMNNHRTTRKIELGGETYRNKADFYTMIGEIENKIRYEMVSASGRLKGGFYTAFTMGYGTISGFTEKGDGIFLDFKEKDLRILRPEAGADLTASAYTENGKMSLTAKVSYSRDLVDLYETPNEVKIAGTSADYYALETPDEGRNLMKFGLSAKYETKSGHDIGFDLTRTAGSKETTRVGVHYTYRM
jgi:hypothetical protein